MREFTITEFVITETVNTMNHLSSIEREETRELELETVSEYRDNAAPVARIEREVEIEYVF